MSRVQVKIVLDPDLLRAVDEARGDVSRSVWIARTLDDTLRTGGTGGRTRSPQVSTSSPSLASGKRKKVKG